MKKNYWKLGLMSAIISLAACTKEDVENNTTLPETTKTICHTVAVSEETWGDESRSEYISGSGIKLTGEETMTVYYSVPTDDDATTYAFAGNVKATPSGNGIYTFSHEAVDGATVYDYYFMMPHHSNNNKNSSGTASYHRLGPVQEPSATSFDPNLDYIIGKPVLGVAQSDGQTLVTQFKRMVAPLCVTFTDPDNLFTGEKIHEVTLAFNAEATKEQCINGIFYVNYSDKYADSKISSWESKSISNSLTATYADGIEQSGQWESWFMVSDTTIPTCDMTITVVTDKQRITRTVTLTSELAIQIDKINRLKISLPKASCTTTQIMTVSTSGSSVPATLSMSDGTTLEWTTENLASANNTTRCLAFKAKESAFTLPAIEGVTYKRIYLTEHLSNGNKDYILGAYDAAGTELAKGSFNHYDETIRNNGGILALDLGEGVSGAVTVKRTDSDTNTNCRISRITIEYTGEVPEEVVDRNDYWALYNAGEDIQVGDMTINKTTFPDGQLVCMDSAESEDKIRTGFLQKGGLYFLDTYHNTDGSDAEDQVLTLTSNLQPLAEKETIIIGRWVNKQSKLESTTYTDSKETVAGTYLLLCKAYGGGVALKNIEWTADPLTANLFARGANIEADIKYFIVEDCTLTAYQHLYRWTNVKNEYVVEKSIFRNNIIKMLGTNNNYNVASISKDANYTIACNRIKSLEISNSVIICPETVAAGKRRMLIDYGSGGSGYAYDMSSMAITVKNNTIYNLHASSNVMVRAYRCASAQIEGNLCYVDGTDATSVTANCYMFGLYAHKDGTTDVNLATYQSDEEASYKVINNFSSSYNMTATDKNGNIIEGWTFMYKDNNPVSYYDEGNQKSVKSTTANHVFSTANLTTGYLPVNTTVVTNGAGATYTTKLWNQWE